MSTVKLSIYRFNPEEDRKPYFQDYEIEITEREIKLLDLLVKLKSVDD